VCALLSALCSADRPAAIAARQPARLDTELLERVKTNLQRERALLLEYAYRERRRPMKVSPLGGVSLGEVQTFDVEPSGDPDRPRRTLIEVNNRPATAAERAEYARRSPFDGPADEQQRRERVEGRRRAQERLEDAFRIYAFDTQGTDTLDGLPVRVVRVLPKPGVEPRSDVGRWMKKFEGIGWVDDEHGELVKLEMTATDSISIGWGIVGRIAEGTKLTYARRPLNSGIWLPVRARFDARGRTLLFRSFKVDVSTEWFDYRPASASVSP